MAEALKHFAGVRYRLFAYVVMDDHVHVLTKPLQELSLQNVVHGWQILFSQ